MRINRRYPAWSSFDCSRSRDEGHGNNWPTFFLKRNRRGEFTDRKGNVVTWELRNPASVDFKGNELKQVRSALRNLTPDKRKKINFYGEHLKDFWFRITENLISSYKLSPMLSARVRAALTMGLSDTAAAVHYVKNLYDVPRPHQLDATLQPVLSIPSSPSFVCEQASAAGCAHIILSYFFPHEDGKLKRLAEEISWTMFLAAIQYKADVEEGMKLGRQMGDMIVVSLRYQRVEGDVQKSNRNSELTAGFQQKKSEVISR
ncbi:hypothetical protein GA0061096_1496 [Fictibacillus enclensis]|uniref:Uncharacterized protein n=1 Tax=Fictibacillus enclensis TaxID=1017270 RepID=A0A0V8JE72_9BACL|nr:hypothetical protein [Fictibacillus enclensis]KSU85273.1 hypothetical protein AS030_07120 [Fictibacillus enclensis]SCB94164.1 hypothetical protein GA0061096_1496 [Fictibacillus enclensis]